MPANIETVALLVGPAVIGLFLWLCHLRMARVEKLASPSGCRYRNTPRLDRALVF
jgi:hypothetical protein